MIKINTRTKKNPTDKEFLKSIYIEKNCNLEYHTIGYYVFENKNKIHFNYRLLKTPLSLSIAFAHYDTNDQWVYDLAVKLPYQRKGLATYLYDYIEKDQNVKLKPSDELLSDGKAFWKNRLKNPRDNEFLAKINIVKYNLKNSPYTNYVAYLNNREVVSEASFDRENKKVELIRTEDKYKRKGLASLIYDYIEEDQRVKLKPSSTLLSDGKAFWKARRKAKNDST